MDQPNFCLFETTAETDSIRLVVSVLGGAIASNTVSLWTALVLVQKGTWTSTSLLVEPTVVVTETFEYLIFMFASSTESPTSQKGAWNDVPRC